MEGITDYWYLASACEYLKSKGVEALPDELVLMPCGGASKVGYMVALMAAQNLGILVLLDDEPEGRRTAEEIVKSKLIPDDHIVLVSTGQGQATSEVDIEDLIEPDVFGKLVRATYDTELTGKTLALDPQIPRIVKRYEEAFKELNLPFHKTRPAKRFMQMVGGPDSLSVMSAVTEENFKRLITEITTKHAKFLRAKPA
jgi:hypothetical protein